MGAHIALASDSIDLTFLDLTEGTGDLRAESVAFLNSIPLSVVGRALRIRILPLTSLLSCLSRSTKGVEADPTTEYSCPSIGILRSRDSVSNLDGNMNLLDGMGELVPNMLAVSSVAISFSGQPIA